MTRKFLCGADCGIDVAGTASAGVEHWSATDAGFVIDSAVTAGAWSTRSFLSSLAAAGTADGATHTFGTAIASGGTIVAGFYYRISSMTDVQTRTIFSTPDGLAGLKMKRVDAFGGYILTLWAGNAAPTEQTLAVIFINTWYWIDIKILRGTTITVTARIDNGTDVVATKATQTATTIPGFRLFSNTSGTGGNTSTIHTARIDDLVIDDDSTVYPIGIRHVEALFPNGDGVHAYNAAGDFGKGSGGNTNLAIPSSSETTSWQDLQNPLSTTIPTNFLADKASAIDGTEFLRHTLADLPVVKSVGAAMLVVTTHSASATANQLSVGIYNGSANATLLAADLSESTITVPIVVRTTDAAGAAWDRAKINATQIQWWSTDVTPDVYLDGVCLEVDYAPGLGGLISTVTSVHTAQALGESKLKALGIVTTVNAAQALVKRKTKSVPLVTEVDTAQVLGQRKTRLLGLITEVDTPQTVTRRKTSAVGLVTEVDTAQVITGRKIHQLALGTVTEVDTSQVLAFARQLLSVTEVDTALALTKLKRQVVTFALEVDGAQAVTSRKLRALGVVAELDTAQVVARTKQVAVSPVIEIDTAQLFGRRKTRLVPTVAEVDAAQIVRVSRVRQLGTATELDTSQGVGRTKRAPIIAASEVDTALAIASGGLAQQLGTIIELDAVLAIAKLKRHVLPLVTEFDQSLGITAERVLSITPVVEVDAARTIGEVKLAVVMSVIEQDAAPAIFFPGRTRSIATVIEVNTALDIIMLGAPVVGTNFRLILLAHGVASAVLLSEGDAGVNLLAHEASAVLLSSGRARAVVIHD